MMFPARDPVDDLIAIDNARTAERWAEHAQRLEGQLKRVKREKELMEAEVAQLHGENQQLRLNSALDRSEIAGLVRMKDALVNEAKTCDPNKHSLIIEDTAGNRPLGKIYKDGFIREAEAHGIQDPQKYL